MARHELTTPGRPRISDEHYPPRPPGALNRRPRAKSAEEAAFLAIGPGAAKWLTRAAAAGASRVRRKMAEAVDLAKMHGALEVDAALEAAAEAGRFGDGDLASILAHREGAEVIELPRRHSRGGDPAGLDRRLAGVREMSVKTPEAPPLPSEIERLLRSLRLPHIRRAAPEVLATAASQRWEPSEVLRVLLAEEERAARRGGDRHPPAPLGPARRQDLRGLGGGVRPRSPPRPSRRCAPWSGSSAARTSASAGRAAPARATSPRRSGTWRSTGARPSPGTPWRASRPCCAATAPTARSPRRSPS